MKCIHSEIQTRTSGKSCFLLVVSHVSVKWQIRKEDQRKDQPLSTEVNNQRARRDKYNPVQAKEGRGRIHLIHQVMKSGHFLKMCVKVIQVMTNLEYNDILLQHLIVKFIRSVS